MILRRRGGSTFSIFSSFFTRDCTCAAWLARALTGLGEFTEGRRHGEEALRLATLAGRGITLIIAHNRLGNLYLAQGDLEHAIRVLEPGLALCRVSGNRAPLGPTLHRAGASGGLEHEQTEGLGRERYERRESPCGYRSGPR